MRTLKGMLLATVLVLAPGAAVAADMPAEEPVPQVYAANSGWYLRGDIGWSFLHWDGPDDDDTITGGGGVGYKWNQWFRTDVRADLTGNYDVGRFRNEANDHDVSTITVLGNGYLDLPLTPIFRPYVGAGAGWGWVDDVPGVGRGNDDGFAWAAYGGATFDVSQNFAIDVGYRYRQIDIDGPNFKDHSVLAGFRWTFGAPTM